MMWWWSYLSILLQVWIKISKICTLCYYIHFRAKYLVFDVDLFSDSPASHMWNSLVTKPLLRVQGLLMLCVSLRMVSYNDNHAIVLHIKLLRANKNKTINFIKEHEKYWRKLKIAAYISYNCSADKFGNLPNEGMPKARESKWYGIRLSYSI